MKKVNMFVGTLLFFVLLGVSTVSADALSPEEALSNAYDASLEGDSEKYYNSVIDERFDSAEEAIFFYDGNFLEDPLVSYEIVDSIKINENNYELTVITEYKSGVSFELPVKVTDINGAWKMLITDETLEEDEFEVLNSGSVLHENRNMKLPGLDKMEETIQPQAAGMLFRSFSTGYILSHTEPILVKNIPSRSLILYVSNQTSSSSLTYRLTNKRNDGNTVIASRTVSGSKKNYQTSFSLSTNATSAYWQIVGGGKTNGGLYY